MKDRTTLWFILVAALILLTVNLSGNAGASYKLVKVGGQMNHCDCTCRIQ